MSFREMRDSETWTPFGAGPTTEGLEQGQSPSGGDYITLTPHLQDPANIRMSFYARIVSQGPEGEPDFEDARYWVKEVRLKDDDDRLTFFNEDDEVEGRLHVEAVNLAELRQASRGNETHEKGFGDGPADDALVVHVFALIQPDGTPRYMFSEGGGGTITQEAVIVEVRDDLLICTAWPVPQEPILFAVAKPWLLRRNPWHQGPDRLGITYEYDPDDSQIRIASRDGVTETQIVTPLWVPDDVIKVKGPYVGELLEDENGDPVLWYDENNDGRFWAEEG